tara:strand:- start:927 stop:1382 length:456 start_codon:yes stop_codon:yes gene_type:complete
MNVINNNEAMRNNIVPDIIDIRIQDINRNEIQDINRNEIQDINRNEIQDINRNNRYVPNVSYYAWYCVRHGDCFLTSVNREPEIHESRCGVLNQCNYEYLGFLSLENGIRFFPDRNMNLQNFFNNHDDGYTMDMFDNMINSPINRNGAILF